MSTFLRVSKPLDLDVSLLTCITPTTKTSPMSKTPESCSGDKPDGPSASKTLIYNGRSPPKQKWPQQMHSPDKMLWNSLEHRISHTFSCPPTDLHTSPLKNSFLSQINSTTFPLLFPMPRSLKQNSVPSLIREMVKI